MISSEINFVLRDYVLIFFREEISLVLFTFFLIFFFDYFYYTIFCLFQFLYHYFEVHNENKTKNNFYTSAKKYKFQKQFFVGIILCVNFLRSSIFFFKKRVNLLFTCNNLNK